MDQKTAEQLIMEYVILCREFGVQSWQSRQAALAIKKRFKEAVKQNKGSGMYEGESTKRMRKRDGRRSTETVD